MKDFLVEYHHVPVEEVTDVCEKKILDKMCEEAAKGFDLKGEKSIDLEKKESNARNPMQERNN